MFVSPPSNSKLSIASFRLVTFVNSFSVMATNVCVLNIMTPTRVKFGEMGNDWAILDANPIMEFQLSYLPGADTMLVDSSMMRTMSAIAGHATPD